MNKDESHSSKKTDRRNWRQITDEILVALGAQPTYSTYSPCSFHSPDECQDHQSVHSSPESIRLVVSNNFEDQE